MIENRDTFNDWHQYAAHAGLSRALVVYRGHDRWHSRACKALLRRWRDLRPEGVSVYFGDCDLAGLQIAVSAGYQALLLPRFDWLRDHQNSGHYAPQHLKYLPQLLRDCPPGWQPLLRQLAGQRAALRQQWMTGVPLQLLRR